MTVIDVLHDKLRQLDRDTTGGSVTANTSTRYWAEQLAEALGLREEYAIVDRHQAGDIAEVHEEPDEAIEAMELYSMDAWMAGQRWVSDWQNLKPPG